MGLFGLFKKKTEYFDKKIEPKCAYCEFGQPGRSSNMILCTKCGIVNEDYSCKKFVYSPLKRIPDKEHPAPDPSLINKKEAAVQPATETKAEAAVKPVQTVTETRAEAAVKPVQIVTDAKTETAVKPVQTVTDAKTETAVKPVLTATEAKTETAPTSAISEIHNTPHSNEENIKKLESLPKSQLSGIANEVAPKEINLPDVSDDNVSSISNSPTERNSEAYLKTVPEQAVSGFVNNGHTVHKLPENTKTQALSELK